MSNGNGVVNIIRTSDHTLVGDVPVGRNPTSIRANSYGTLFAIANAFSGSISIFDPWCDEVIRSIGVGASPKDVFWADFLLDSE